MFLAAAVVPWLAVAYGGEVPAFLVVAGEVTERSAVIWARAAREGPVTVEVAPDGKPRRQRASASATAETDFTVKVRFEGLTPASRHVYRVVSGADEVRGAFVTAPPADVVLPVRLVWSGDLGGGGHCRSPGAGYEIFRAMRARRPDVFVFVGDTIYADHRCRVPENLPGADFRARDLAGFRVKHRYNRGDPAFAAFLQDTSVYAIWDDHEVRNDFAGPTEPLMPVGRRAFLEYWPIEPAPGDSTRLYRRARWGRLVELFVLDTRQYRSDNLAPDGPGKTMLGARQRDWLLDGLSRSDAVWKLVVSSVSLSVPTGRAGRDGWASGSPRFDSGQPPTGFEHELGTIVRELAGRGVQNVVWLVADVHRAEIIRHAPLPRLVFHELIAGPLSAGTGRPGWLDDTLRPTRLYGEGGFLSFGELVADASGLTVRIIDAAGRIRFETTLAPQR